MPKDMEEMDEKKSKKSKDKALVIAFLKKKFKKKDED